MYFHTRIASFPNITGHLFTLADGLIYNPQDQIY
jgi:hypothetical protein